jgi:hypothetical protein
MTDPGTDAAALKWLPLAGWSRLPCPPLPARTARIAEILNGNGHPLGVASHALNMAALLASDCGMDNLARDLCHRQIQTYLRLGRLLTADEGRLMLGPALNLARLDLRADNADEALRRLEDIDKAIASSSDLAVDGSVLPVSAIDGTSEEHAKLRNIVRALHVSDGIRAHAMAGRWHLAAGLAETLGGVYPRLLEGRQAAVIARCLAGDLNGARWVLTQAAVAESWEDQVAACLAVLASPAGEITDVIDTMTNTFLTSSLPEDRVLFRARLSATVVALSRETCPDDAAQVAATAADEAIRVADAYATRDILATPAVADLLGPYSLKELARITDESGLGRGTMPPALADVFHRTVEKALTDHGTALARPALPSTVQLARTSCGRSRS